MIAFQIMSDATIVFNVFLRMPSLQYHNELVLLTNNLTSLS